MAISQVSLERAERSAASLGRAQLKLLQGLDLHTFPEGLSWPEACAWVERRLLHLSGEVFLGMVQSWREDVSKSTAENRASFVSLVEGATGLTEEQAVKYLVKGLEKGEAEGWLRQELARSAQTMEFRDVREVWTLLQDLREQEDPARNQPRGRSTVR